MEKEGQATIKSWGENAPAFKNVLTYPQLSVDKRNEDTLSKLER